MKGKINSKSMSILRARLLSFILAFLLALGISFAAGQPGSAQFLLLEDLTLEDTADPSSGVTRYGNIEAIVVKSPLSSRKLFTIASPTVYDRSPDSIGEQMPVEQRAAAIQDKLLLLIKRPMDPESLVFEVSMLHNLPVIDVRDAEFPEPLILATVTEYDDNYAGVPVDELAMKWRDALEEDLRSGLENLPESRQRVNTIVSSLIILSVVVFGLKFAISRRQKQLRQRKKVINAEVEHASSAEEFQTKASPETIRRQVEQKRANLLRELQQTSTLDRRLSILDFIQWLLFWLVILAWYGGVAWVAWVSPYILLNSPIGEPLKVIVGLLSVWFFIGLAIRISRHLIDHFATEREGLYLGNLMAFGDIKRRNLRVLTVAVADWDPVGSALSKGLYRVVDRHHQCGGSNNYIWLAKLGERPGKWLVYFGGRSVCGWRCDRYW